MVTHWETVDKDDTDDDCGGLVEDFGLVVGACDNEKPLRKLTKAIRREELILSDK